MSAADAAALDRAIAHTVADLVITAVSPDATTTAYSNARDAAQMLALDGLDHALAACAAHAGSAMPADVAALADRLARLALAVREAGDLAPFRAADGELNALAAELNGSEWAAATDGGAERPAAPAGLDVHDVLDEVTLAGDDSRAVARRSRLPVPVAAAVRAVIDWLVPSGAAGPVRLFGEPSLLELRLERIRTDRLYAAHRVIAAAGGNLGPSIESPGWIVRVPSLAERPTYLMLVQGGLRIALPWHAVLKLRIVAANVAPGGTLPMDHAVVAPLAPPAPDLSEHPVVLLGHGLKRAYLIADRLIWRMTAEPCENEWGSPADGLRETVCTEDGEVFWIADPARLLADVELPDIATEPPPAPEPEPRVLSDADVEPLGITPVEGVSVATAVTLAAAAAPAQPAELAPLEPAAVEAPEPPVPVEVEPAPVARALVVDDSLTTRLLLARLLERQGFTVETVSRSATLMRRLTESAWTVLFTDLELPDGGGPEWLRQVCRVAASRPHPVHVVALVRDGGDLDVARAAGVEDTLLKPFARESLAALLTRHRWIAP